MGPKIGKLRAGPLPCIFPPIIEEPEEFLPQELPPADILLCLGESTGVAELIPDLAKMSQVKAVIAPVDDREHLPAGLKNQIRRDLETLGICSVFPLPFCSLTERASDNEYIREFARYFGRPKLAVTFKGGKIQQVILKREAPCGSTRFLAGKLMGLKLEEAERSAALLHQYYPCLAFRKIERKLGYSLLHRSADITRQAVRSALLPYL